MILNLVTSSGKHAIPGYNLYAIFNVLLMNIGFMKNNKLSRPFVSYMLKFFILRLSLIL